MTKNDDEDPVKTEDKAETLESADGTKDADTAKAATTCTIKETVEIHTDGACSGNPGPGGWGAVLRWRGLDKELSGYEAETTNNRMELMAAIQALETLKRPMKVRMITDSNYVKRGITGWLMGWKANGWKTADKKPVKNKDLWERLDAASQRHQIEWRWVKGHAGNPDNERADKLATQAIKARGAPA